MVLGVTSVYETDLDNLVDKVIEANSREFGSDNFKELRDLARKKLLQMRKIAVDTPLLSYGEQADPPIIKNAGKTILAEILRRKLKEHGLKGALNMHDVLYDDTFGSNSEVFKDLGLLGSNQCKILGQQTYTKAAASGEYIVLSIGFIRSSTKQDITPLVSEIALEELRLFGSGKERSIGEFNIALREKLEGILFPFKFRRLNLSEFEHALLSDLDTLHFLTDFSGYAPGPTQGKKGFYVVFKSEDAHGQDSGYRRLYVQRLGREDVAIFNPFNSGFRLSSLTDLMKDPRTYRISLDASSRAALSYAMCFNGVGITGGGSTYNECVSTALVAERGFPKPLLTYLSNPDFAEGKQRSLAMLLGKEDVVKSVVDGYKDIRTTDAREFALLIGGVL
ncbi:hypothetical protein J4216_00700 [Candidatus Woesearchaeota archaeon]|nr:hypothetical protein [Candidatus Woesearchaeota archaeon]